MLEVAYIFVAIALIVFIVYLIITLQKVGRVIDETETTVKTLTSDVNMDFIVCSEDKSHYWGVYFAPIDKTEEIDLSLIHIST